MKSFLLVFVCLGITFYVGIAQSDCATYQYQQQETARFPSLQSRITGIENLINRILNNDQELSVQGIGPGGLSIIRIPVVVHILYKNADENIADEQVLSQLEVLNKEFRKIHADTAKIPLQFRPIAADCYIEFVLAKINPQGYATSGIVRKKTSAYSFGLDDKIKFSSLGGDDGWDSDRYLNIWVANLTAGIIGYSSILGSSKEKDGIAMRYSAFGTKGKLTLPYDKGRTAIHEVGHWLGLRHIWGDQYCGNDGVEDTPPQGIATHGCPSGFVSSCNNMPAGNMYNNYMDLTVDECTNMFTVGQRDKMRACFAVNGPRYSLLSSNAATGIPLPDPPPIDLVLERGIYIFPNPATNFITVNFFKEEIYSGTVLTIYNQLGQRISQVKITKQITTVNLQSLKQGTYFIKAGNQSKPFKLLIISRATNP
ncbi:MAG: M43 family zinc metalloprotease [Chitinophagaceae bacterium]